MSKYIIHYRAIGNAPILKKIKYYINSKSVFKVVILFLKKMLLDLKTNFFFYLKSKNNLYNPNDTELLSELYSKFGYNNEIVIYYSYNTNKNNWCIKCNWQICECNYFIEQLIQNNIEYYIINLKVISNIKPNDKLIVDNNYLQIDNYDMLQSIRRWYLNRNRNSLILFLKHFLKNIIKILKIINIDRSKYKDNLNIDIFLLEINKSKNGFHNIICTYDDKIVYNIIYPFLNYIDKNEK